MAPKWPFLLQKRVWKLFTFCLPAFFLYDFLTRKTKVEFSHEQTQGFSKIPLRRGLSTEGGLAQVRGRVRVARAKERQLDAK